MPLAWCGFAHFIFFSQPPLAQSAMVGLVHFVASAGVLVGYGLVHLVSLRKRSDSCPKTLPLVAADSPTVQIGFLVACLVIQLTNPVLALIQGASLIQVLFGMRLLTGHAKVSPETALLFVILHRTPVVGIALGRLWIETFPNKAVRLLWWFLFFAFLISGFASGGRTALIFPIMVMLAVDTYVLKVLGVSQTRGRRIFRKASFVILILVAVGGMAYQSAFRSIEMRSLSDVQRGLQTLFSKGPDTEEGLGAELAGGLNGTVAWVVANYGDTIPFAYFYSVYAMVVNPFPRYLWPDKPAGWGRRLAWEVLGQPPGSAGTSMAAGIGGEAYANGGFPTVILFGLLFGMLFGWMNLSLLRPKSLVSAGFWLGALTWTFGLWRGDWLSNVNRLSYSIFGAWLLYRLMRLVLGKSSEFQTIDSGPARCSSNGSLATERLPNRRNQHHPARV